MLTGVAARVKWLASEWQLLAQSGRSNFPYRSLDECLVLSRMICFECNAIRA